MRYNTCSKRCNICGKHKPLSEWGSSRSTSDGLRTECKACGSSRNIRATTERRRKLSALKMERGCVDCGYNEEPSALEFDHLPEYEKSFTIGSAGSNKGWDTLYKETLKCEVVCANCHRKRTSNRLRDQRVESYEDTLRIGKWDPVPGPNQFQGVFVWA